MVFLNTENSHCISKLSSQPMQQVWPCVDYYWWQGRIHGSSLCSSLYLGIWFTGFTIKWNNSQKERKLVVCSRLRWAPLVICFPFPQLLLSCASFFKVPSFVDWKPSQMAEALSPHHPQGCPWLMTDWEGESRNNSSLMFGWKNLWCNSHSTAACGIGLRLDSSKPTSLSGFFPCSVLLSSPRSFSWEHSLSKSFAK